MKKVVDYSDIEGLAVELKKVGLNGQAENLLEIHRGIFNGTELYMTWRSAVMSLIPSLSGKALERAKDLVNRLDQWLQ